MKRMSDLVNKVDKSRLEQSYEDALTDNRFVTVINNLQLSKAQVISNVYLIQETINEKQNCIDCQLLKTCKNEIKGFCQTPKVKHEQIYVDYIECKFNQKRRKNEKYLDYIYSFEVPEQLKNADMSDLYTDDTSRYQLLSFVSEFLEAYLSGEKPKGAYIYGNNGCGKTHIMAAMINALAKRDVKCGIIYFPELLRSLKANFGNNYDERFLYIRNIEVLVLDDIGAEKITEWGRDEILSSLLQFRMQANLPTFFTSNLSIKALEQHFINGGGANDLLKAKRIIERVSSLCEKIEINGKNIRKN